MTNAPRSGNPINNEGGSMGSISNPVRKQGAAVTKGTGVLTAAGHKALATSALPVPRGRGPISRLADGGQVQVSQQANGTTSFSGGNVSGAPTYTGGSPGGGGTVSSLGPSPSSGPSAAATAMNNAADIYHSMAAGASPASSAPTTSTTGGGPAAGAAPAPGSSSAAPPVDLLDPGQIAQRNQSVRSVFGPSAAAAPAQPAAAPVAGNLTDPANQAAWNNSVKSVFPSAPAPAAPRQPAAGAPAGPSLAQQQATQMVASPFGFADGGMIPGAPGAAPAPIAPAAAVSPFSIRGIAQGVAGAYNGAVDKTADAILAARNHFGHPIGYDPGAPVGTPPPAPVAAPAPAPTPLGLPRLGGLNLDVIQQREAAAGLADGGPVSRMAYVASPVTPSAAPMMKPRGAVSRASGGVIQGPGTGTSDSIPTTMTPGSYVVPADSTQTMQASSPDGTPVNLSNGETALTPEDVHAVGTAALNALKHLTHRNVRMPQRRGKANGGPVSNMALRKIGMLANNVSAPPPPAVPGVRAVLGKADGGPVSQLADQIPPDIPPPVGGAAGRGFVNPPMVNDPAAAGAGRGAVNPAAADPNAPAPQNAPATATMGAGPGPVSSMVANAPGVMKVTAPGAATLYTNDPSSVPATMAPSGPISAQNQQAADNLSAKYDQQALGGAAMMMGPSAAANPNTPALAGAWIPGVNAPASQAEQETIAHNQQVDQQEAKRQALQSGRLGVDLLRGEEANATQLAATGMQQAGANQRTGMTEAGANQRAQLQSDTETALRGPLTGLAVQEGQQKILQGQQAIAAQKAYQDALASGDPKQIDAAEMALRGQTGHLPLRYEAGSGGTLGADTLANLARQYIGGDHSVLNGLGGGAMGAMNRGALMQAVTQEMQNRGMSPEQINAAKLNFASEAAGASTSGKRQANLDMAATEAAQSFDLVRQASQNVSRTQFVPLNKALMSYRSNTGDPNVVALGAAANALLNEYSRAVAGGVPTVSDKMHAEALLNTAQTPQQQEAVLNMMQKEIEFARNSPKMIQQERAQRLGAQPGAAPAQPAPAAAGGPQPAVLAELRRRAANDPALAQRLSSMGY